jgi:hypothetical protein
MAPNAEDPNEHRRPIPHKNLTAEQYDEVVRREEATDTLRDAKLLRNDERAGSRALSRLPELDAYASGIGRP